MVKFSNKAKGKPTKRKTLKTKYKIERKVKQHKKKLRKQMRKLSHKNIKPKKSDKDNVLPNSFPFKAQILQHFKNQQPTQDLSLTEPQVAADWGLVALENRNAYFPKDKDHLTKKYLTSYQKIWEYANYIVHVVDARNAEICLSAKIIEQAKNRGVKLLVVLCKIDTVREKYLNKMKQSLEAKQLQCCLFTTDQKRKNGLLEQLLNKIKEHDELKTKRVVVVGKANTGKHTLIKQFMKLAKFHNEDYATINDVHITEKLNILDTPYKIEEDQYYPLFLQPSSLLEESIAVQEQRAIKYLFFDNLPNRNELLMHYGIQDYISVDDLLKKVGKANRMFGKGGMVNVAAVRTSMLSDWYHGKLNYLFE